MTKSCILLAIKNQPARYTKQFFLMTFENCTAKNRGRLRSEFATVGKVSKSLSAEALAKAERAVRYNQSVISVAKLKRKGSKNQKYKEA